MEHHAQNLHVDCRDVAQNPRKTRPGQPGMPIFARRHKICQQTLVWSDGIVVSGRLTLIGEYECNCAKAVTERCVQAVPASTRVAGGREQRQWNSAIMQGSTTAERWDQAFLWSRGGAVHEGPCGARADSSRASASGRAHIEAGVFGCQVIRLPGRRLPGRRLPSCRFSGDSMVRLALRMSANPVAAGTGVVTGGNQAKGEPEA